MITFFVKRSKDAKIEGPFTIEQINLKIREKELSFDSLAQINRNFDWPDLESLPKKQWVKLCDVPGFEPDPGQEKGCLLAMFFLLVLFIVFVVVGLIKLNNILHRIH